MEVALELETLVRRAAAGEVKAFVEITRRFQHFAFGSALALVHDFHHAEDVTQEAFVAAWLALPSLADPAAFPGWFRAIVRRQAFRQLRRKGLHAVPLTEAEDIRSEEQAADHLLEQREQAAAALAAIAELPTRLREPATLFFVHECTRQDIAVFLGLSVATVNNRVHAARLLLKARMLTMVENALHSNGLPDDFANRIGRLVGAHDGLMDALFDPTALPDILTEIEVSDEANRRTVNVQVVQRPGGGIVRGVTPSLTGDLPRGSAVLNSGRRIRAPIEPGELERLAPLLAGRAAKTGAPEKLVETGIKVIDVMCPLIAGGFAVFAGEHGAGSTVVMEELVRRLRAGADRVSLFMLMPRPSLAWPFELEAGFSWADSLKNDGYSEGTVGPVQTFFLRGQGEPWTAEALAALGKFDVVIRLSRALGLTGIWPAVDPLASRSQGLEGPAASEEHKRVAVGVRESLAELWAADNQDGCGADPIVLERARKLQKFFAQRFYVAEPYSKLPGSFVSLSDAVLGCSEILAGKHDNLPIEAFYFGASVAEIERKAAQP
jgi:RNA polymerase sigma factor (sigma-70 family)